MSKVTTTTKRFETVSEKYQIKRRKGPTKVEHLTYKTVTEVDPDNFMAFELCLKALYQHYQLREGTDHPLGGFDSATFQDYQWRLCNRNGIDVPNNAPWETDAAQAHKDYLYGAAIIRDAGLYFKLLD